MKDFIKYLTKEKQTRLFFLLAVIAFQINLGYYIPGFDSPWNWICILFIVIVTPMCFLQVWREYKKKEGLFGK